MPPGFTVVGQKANFLIPSGQTAEQMRAVRGRDNSYAVARLREGVSFERAYSEMREHLRRARERGAAAQRPADGDAVRVAGTDGRGSPAGAVRAGRRRGPRAAGGLRQRGEPAAGAERRARARGRRAHRARRRTRTPGAPDAHRKPGARGRGRPRRARRRGVVSSRPSRAGRGSDSGSAARPGCRSTCRSSRSA